MQLRIVFFCFAFLPMLAVAQDEPIDERFSVDTPVSLDFKRDEEVVATKKKKKVKKKVFYGVKTRKGFTRKGVGNRVTYELFYYLKVPENPQTFARDLYWYDYTRREIRNTKTFDPKKGVLLHGPYTKKQNDVVLETGIFYKGSKHGRWMTYNRDSVLIDKNLYYKGWPKESIVSYYDPVERKHMKEITPIEFGEKEGYYYRFHENGKFAVTGEYQWDQKVGDWIEYYPDGKRKRIITYSKKAFDDVKPYIKTEWNAKGKEIYRNNKTSR